MQELEHEDKIVWVKPKGDYEYVREGYYDAGTRTRSFNPIGHIKGMTLVAYSVLKKDAPNIGVNGYFERRYFFVKEHDRTKTFQHPKHYKPGEFPCEFILVNQVVPGISPRYRK